MHDLPLISTIAAAFTAAWLLGLLTQKLRLSPIVGYLVAGVLIGPHTPGFVGDVHLAQQLAEVGVILLMFGVGLHFHLKDLIAVKNMAIPGAIGQSLIATVAAMLIFSAFGMPMKTGAVLGMAMASAGFLALTHLSMAAAKCHDSSPLPIFRCGDRLANVVGVRAIGRHGGLSPGMPEPAAAVVLTEVAPRLLLDEHQQGTAKRVIQNQVQRSELKQHDNAPKYHLVAALGAFVSQAPLGEQGTRPATKKFRQMKSAF